MNTPIKTGGPAFPETSPDPLGGNAQVSGMTMRDYFAAKAIQGFLASFAGADCRMPTPEQLAHDAYQQADAMIAERSKP